MRENSRKPTADLSTPLRSGRDDNSSWKQCLAFPNKIVIPTEAEGSPVPPFGLPKFWSSHADSLTGTFSFLERIPSEAKAHRGSKDYLRAEARTLHSLRT